MLCSLGRGGTQHKEGAAEVAEAAEPTTHLNNLIETCMRISEGITYYEDELKNYKYDDQCFPYREIGNYVLEKHNLSSYNCYRKIQKPLCKMSYTSITNPMVEEIDANKSCHKHIKKYTNEENENVISNISQDEEHVVVKNNREEKGETGRTNVTSMMDTINENTRNKHISEVDNINVGYPQCVRTKELFTSLLLQCLENGYGNPMSHCASLDMKKNVILDGELFCQSSYERRRLEMEEDGVHKSIYGNNYKKYIIKTFDFKKDEMDNCIDMVNIFNQCSIVEKSIFPQKKPNDCIQQGVKHFCNEKIQKMDDVDYINTCSDIILPYLLISKYKNNTYYQLCHNINDYANMLKRKKNQFLKKKKKIQENVKHMKLTQKLYKITEYIFQTMYDETEKYNVDINDLFKNLKNIKRVHLPNEYMSKLNNVNQGIAYLENLIDKMVYPNFNKSSIHQNILLVNETKEYIKNILDIQKSVLIMAKMINKYIHERLHTGVGHISEVDNHIVFLNFDELTLLQKRHQHMNEIIQKYADTGHDSIFQYQNSLMKDFHKDIEKINNSIEMYTSQISLLLKKGLDA
ncbi:hypothetical protein, conserved [Plasmodium gonderi]|uniref:Uncharacterized protein n=1 Tax=Plasmodium gonderi TaxID=77519 RepID=A0A1Y1JHK4_PLAGO|nr:hypothetical protein, conserved [Plasmodium gonderi]GAW81128.1 hypothetical protein, conserved [Plasmodium gonderi]